MSSESSSDKNQKENTDLPLKNCNDGSLEQPTVSCLYATAVSNKDAPVESNTIKTIGTSSSPLVSDTGAMKTVLGYELLQSEEHSDTKLVPLDIKNENENENDYHDSHTEANSEKIAEQLISNDQQEHTNDQQSPHDEQQQKQHQQDYNLLNDDYEEDLDDNNGYSETIAKNNFDKNGIPPPPGEPKPENKARLRRYRLNMD